MEDWAYAAGWDRSGLRNCSGFRSSHEETGDSKPHASALAIENRALVFLVETSNAKRPADNTWGRPQQVVVVIFLVVEGNL